jgi:hypothetical protein
MKFCGPLIWIHFGDHNLENRDPLQQEFATCEIANCRNTKCKIHFVSCNPTVQVNSNMIGGLLFHLIVN